MPGRWWDVYAKPMRDKIAALVKARAEADGVNVGEVVAGLTGRDRKYVASGIYVLPPSMRPLGGNENTPTEAQETEATFPIECRCEAFTEADYLELVGVLVGVVVDAIDANPTFGTVSASGEAATAEQVYVAEVHELQLIPGEGDVPSQIDQVVDVRIKLVRTTA